MLACVDVHYEEERAVAAALVAADWTRERADEEVVVPLPAAAPYEPGAFYKRELPCLLAALAALTRPFAVVVVDGYVWLDPALTVPGLGAHLHRALDGAVGVVGVAKTAYASARAIPVTRGESVKPLWVTAAGLPVEEAARAVASMHGAHRVPTLLKRVDALCRGRAPTRPGC